MIRFEDVERKVERHHPGADIDLLRRAYIYSAKAHKDQKRASGEPYLVHPLSVANILADMKMDVPTVSTGLLHDVVEDTLATTEEIEKLFSKEIAHLVDGVTKISNLGKSADAQAENLRKMVLAMIDDVRVVIVKLADRLHNMQTLTYLKPEKKRRISRETLEVYAPIAHRLGMGKIRVELEDLAFQYLEPEAYERLKHEVDERRALTEAFIDNVKEKIGATLRESHIDYVRIEGRIKRLYSIHKKLQSQKIPLDKVYDLAAVRVITKEVGDCYSALGVINTHWQPFDGRIKDYIGRKRENGYQSLHTTVVGSDGHPFEVQIRTEEMHRVAEEGVAAHWKYKEGKGTDTSEDEAMKWLRQLVEWQQDVADARDFAESFKQEMALTPKTIFAFTPKGKVLEFPVGATPIDFAYAVHSKVGDQCVGAKANGRIVPLRYQIQMGDRIEIQTQAGHEPSRDWLNFVVTSKARNRIKHAVAERQRIESIEIGRKLFEKEATKLRLKPKQALEDPKLLKFMSDGGLPKPDDLYAALGYGKLTARAVFAKILPEEQVTALEQKGTSRLQKVTRSVKRVFNLGDDGIVIDGNLDGVLLYRAPCCNPVRGEEIIAYITLGKGIGVHARRCKNAANLLINRDRIIPVAWRGSGDPYPVKLSVLTHDRQGQLAAVTKKLTDADTNIVNASTDDSGANDGTRTISMTVGVKDVQHLNRIIGALKGIDGVVEVERADARPG